MMVLQDEREYLAGVFERAKALREVFDGNGGNSDHAREALAGFIGRPGRLLDLLRRCDRLYGLGDHTHRRLDWMVGEWERGPQGYPAIWDSLADKEVLADLERCLEQAGEAQTDAPATHSPDFRSVLWAGQPYTFTPSQAACVKVLWEAWESGSPDVGDATVLEKADCETKRLDHLFRDQPAWGVMIVRGSTKGTHRLWEVASQK